MVQDTTIARLSWSRIRSYLTCSLQWFFRYASNEKPEFTPGALAFGSALHAAMETALVARMADEVPALDHLVSVFSTALDTSATSAPIRWSERETRESATAQARAMLEVWLARPRAGTLIGVEESFDIELTPWLRITGRADVVEVTDDAVIITDLKSSRASWGEEQVLQGQDQLVLYREGLRSIIEAVGKPVKLAWEVITKQKTPRVEVVELKDPPPNAERVIKTATIVQEAIEKKIFVPSPGTMQCHGCPFRTACRGW